MTLVPFICLRRPCAVVAFCKPFLRVLDTPSLIHPLVSVTSGSDAHGSLHGSEQCHGSHASASTKTRIRDSSRIDRGLLSNGMTYMIGDNAEPRSSLALRLVVRAGSMYEQPGEEGWAHLLEHVCFKETDAFTAGTDGKGGLEEYLRQSGIPFGPDANAHTSFDEMAFDLQVQKDSDEQLREALFVMSQWAFHVKVTAAGVDVEKAIVLEELRKTLGAEFRLVTRRLNAVTAGTSYNGHLPIGIEGSIDLATEVSIADLHRRLFRPDDLHRRLFRPDSM
jgi:zinc protease